MRSFFSLHDQCVGVKRVRTRVLKTLSTACNSSLDLRPESWAGVQQFAQKCGRCHDTDTSTWHVQHSHLASDHLHLTHKHSQAHSCATACKEHIRKRCRQVKSYIQFLKSNTRFLFSWYHTTFSTILAWFEGAHFLKIHENFKINFMTWNIILKFWGWDRRNTSNQWNDFSVNKQMARGWRMEDTLEKQE